MKYLVYILLFCFSTLKAQNLITNPSFEDIDSCYGQPASYGFDVFKWSGCKGWSNPIKASSDLWCQNPIVGNITPPNIISYQYQPPRSLTNPLTWFKKPGLKTKYMEGFSENLIDLNRIQDVTVHETGHDIQAFRNWISQYYRKNYDSVPFTLLNLSSVRM